DGIKGSYVKTRLVPFGEYIPFRQQFGWLTKISKAAGSNMIPGTGARLLTVTTAGPRPLSIGVLICFESALPDMSRVQAALTGDTVAFDARGRELAWLGQGSHAVVTVRLNLPAATGRTFYDEAGD